MASKHITLKLFSPLHPLFPGEPDYHFTIFHTINITLYTRVWIIFCSFLTFILLLLYTHFFHCKLTATISLQPHYLMSLLLYWGLPGGSDSKESACNAGGPGSIPGSGRSPGEGNGYPLSHSSLENSMDRGVWQAMGLQRVRHDWLTLFTFTLYSCTVSCFSSL